MLLIIVAIAVVLAGLVIFFSDKIIHFFDWLQKSWKSLGKQVQALVIILIILLASLGWWIIPRPLAETETLWVDSLDSTWMAWTESGTSPYLHSEGEGDINSGVAGNQEGWFTFQDHGGSGTINSVVLKIYARQSGSGVPYEYIRIYLHDGSSEHDLGTIELTSNTYSYFDITVTSILDTWTKIDDAKIRIKHETHAAWNPYVDAAKLYVTYTAAADETNPTYSNPTTNTTLAAQPCNFSVQLSDNIGLSHSRYGTNNTGIWTNDSWTPISGNPTDYTVSVVKTLNSTVGVRVEWRVWFNDTSNNLNNTGIQYLIASESNPPTLSFQCAGPYTSPKFTPPGQGDYQEGYFHTSRQTNTWIYINCSVADESDIDTVWVNWYNGTWHNDTISMSHQETPDRWYVNITGQSYSGDCTFDIFANDTYGNEASIMWKKRIGLDQWTRKYVRFGCSPEPWSYEHYFVQNTTYTEVNRPLGFHEQYVDGDIYDTGRLLTSRPDYVYTQWCMAFVWFWIDENETLNPTEVTNMYYHLWYRYHASGFEWGDVWYMFNAYDRESNIADIDHDYKEIIGNASYEDKTYNDTVQTVLVEGYTYYLTGGFTQVENVTIDSNSIYDLGFCLERSGAKPNVLAHPNMTTFVIFNLPSNATLQGQDTDSDGWNDHEELYTYYTDPFTSDTDNDGASDKWEHDNGYNPLNWTSFGFVSLNLRIKDWDLTNNIEGAVAYVNSDTQTSDSQGWANFTNLFADDYDVKVKYLGYWVNGSFSVTVDCDKIVDVQCELHDGQTWIRDSENNTNIEHATVKFYNTTWHELYSDFTAADGKCSFTNLPNASLGFKVWRNETLVYNSFTPVLVEDIMIQRQVNITYLIANEWINFTIYSTDIGHTLGEINASIWNFAQFTTISKYNTTGYYTFVRGYQWNKDIQILSATDVLFVLATETKLWVHKYD